MSKLLYGTTALLLIIYGHIHITINNQTFDTLLALLVLLACYIVAICIWEPVTNISNKVRWKIISDNISTAKIKITNTNNTMNSIIVDRNRAIITRVSLDTLFTLLLTRSIESLLLLYTPWYILSWTYGTVGLFWYIYAILTIMGISMLMYSDIKSLIIISNKIVRELNQKGYLTYYKQIKLLIDNKVANLIM